MFYAMKNARLIEYNDSGDPRHYILVSAGRIFETQAKPSDPVSVDYKGHSLRISLEYLIKLNDNLELLEYPGRDPPTET